MRNVFLLPALIAASLAGYAQGHAQALSSPVSGYYISSGSTLPSASDYPWIPSTAPLGRDSVRIPRSTYPLQQALMMSEQSSHWKRYALIGAAVGAASGAGYYYFAVESAPENQSNDSWVPAWVGYATFALPGALVGAFIGASFGHL